MQCHLDDAGIGLFLMSMPFNSERSFHEQELSQPFNVYRREVEQHFAAGRKPDDFEHMYKPRSYALFGRFDLAMISLVDDHDFSARVLRPFTHFAIAGAGKKKHPETYTYKVITGPAPLVSDQHSIVTRARETFLDNHESPLVGISLLKLNNAALVGTGATLLADVVDYINAVVNRPERAAHCRAIVLQSYSWHELTVLVFARQYRVITEVLIELRESCFEDVCNSIDETRASALSRALTHDSFLGKLRGHDASLLKQHIFVNTETALGFDFGLVDNVSHPLSATLKEPDRLELFSRWFVKPGHLRAAFDGLAGPQGGQALLSIGHGDLWFPQLRPSTGTEGPGESTLDILSLFMQPRAEEALKDHILRRYTLPAFLHESNSIPGHVSPDHFQIADTLNGLVFSVETLQQLRNDLRRLGASKILSLKLLNAFTNFNEGILDRGLYASFVELRPFLANALDTLKEVSTDGDIASMAFGRLLKKWTENFERAFRNRFHNSQHMGEVTDFSLEFKGGIQQLVTAFDSAYRALSTFMGIPDSFVHVGGDPGVYSTEYELRVNYYHIFQPEIFFAVVGHEAANWHLGSRRQFYSGLELPLFLLSSHDPGPVNLSQCERLIVNELEKEKLHAIDPPEGLFDVLIATVDRAFFQECFADMLSLSLSYNGNASLWAYWNLGYVIQNQILYAKPGVLRESFVLRFLLRMMLVHDLPSPEPLEGWLAEFGDADLLDDAQRMHGWLDFTNRFMRNNGLFGRWRKQAKSAVERATLASCPSLDSLHAIRERVSADAEDQKQQIRRREVPQWTGGNESDAFKFTQSLLYAYLSLLKEEFSVGRPRLRRDENGIPRTDKVNPGDAIVSAPERLRMDGDAALLFDSLGGVFTHDPDVRRTLFAYRSIVTMSLWDFGMKMKLLHVQKRDDNLRQVMQS